MSNYQYVVKSGFKPFTLQEALTPLMMYKDAYEKTEAAYEDLSAQSDKFKYLSETLPEGSKARTLYENYANELNKQANDLAKNGLSIMNRRGLLNLKKRYQGEIGRLATADEAMREEKKLRRELSAKDSSMLYAMDNLSIDQFLDGETPNLYNISGDELRKEGAQYAQAASSRLYGNTQVQNLTKYFQEIMQTQGYSPETMAAFRQNLEAIPEFNQAVQDIMDARGVTGNLTGYNYERARQSIVNGIMEGALYKEARNVQQNPGVMTAAQSAADARAREAHNLQKENRDFERAISGYEKDKDGNWVYNPDKDQTVKKAQAVANAKVPRDENGEPIKKSTPKKPARKLKEARAYDGKGNVSPVTKTSGTKYGRKISFAEAVNYDSSIAQHDPGHEDDYEYWEQNGIITVTPDYSGQEPSGGTGEENPDEHNDV